MTQHGMTTQRMIYLINRAAVMQEFRTGVRPDAITVSRAMFDQLAESFMIVLKMLTIDQAAPTVDHEMRLCGMTLEMNPLMNDTEFVLGTKYDLKTLETHRREEDEQLHGYREPGEGSGDGDHGERDQLVPLCGGGEEETPEAGRG